MRPEHLQEGYDVRLEWGREGAVLLAHRCAVVVIVDVLSFGTAVDVAVGRGAQVLPLPWGTDTDDAQQAAASAGAVLAGRRGDPGWTLSPVSLGDLPAGLRLALPSPNGATLCSLAADRGAIVLAGCVRNAAAIARTAQRLARGGPIGLVPAGERWDLPGHPLRPAVEDAIGAGAIAAVLPGAFSPEAEFAVAQFVSARRRRLRGSLAATASGRELTALGFSGDITVAAEHDVSDVAPCLTGGVLTDGVRVSP